MRLIMLTQHARLYSDVMDMHEHGYNMYVLYSTESMPMDIDVNSAVCLGR